MLEGVIVKVRVVVNDRTMGSENTVVRGFGHSVVEEYARLRESADNLCKRLQLR